MAQAIVSAPLDPRNGFNWVFLVELLICGILTIFFTFYFNRLFATLVSYGIRAYTWRAFNAYIDITSLQISPLGGRIFFKDIRYHGHNETILIHGGFITWNYWLRRVRSASIYADNSDTRDATDASGESVRSTPTSRAASRSRNLDRAEKGGKETHKQLPCRFTVKVSGVEAFMYNRSPAYDGIVEAYQRKFASTEDGQGARSSSVSNPATDQNHQHAKLRKAKTEDHELQSRTGTVQSAPSEVKKPELPAFLRLLPIYLDVTKGAVVLGNEHTEAVITAQFEKATGTIDAAACGPLDIYKQLFNFEITHPVVHMKPNPDFKARQLDVAAQEQREGVEEETPETSKRSTLKRKYYNPWRAVVARFSGFFASSSDSIHTYTRTTAARHDKNRSGRWQSSMHDRWKGLARYNDDSLEDAHGEWDDVQYARTSLIADIPSVNFAFYWDTPGPVLGKLEDSMFMGNERPADINGCDPPEYGMDIQISGGDINYGPWADRHRGIFQSIFFPGSHVDAVPAIRLQPGETRALSEFKIYISIEDDIKLRIPFRESSKDWKWKGKAHTLGVHDKSSTDKNPLRSKARKRRGKNRETASTQNLRPFAWIDVKVTANSSITYLMDMYASSQGFSGRVDVDVKSAEILSSVNHGLLWRSGPLALDCDLSTPLGWNALRKWLFNITCSDLELFLMRDHMFLLMDLVADWGSGPPSDYFLFVPFQYLLNVEFNNFKLYLNTNDSNIVNNPTDLDDNNFVVLHGERLHGDVIIPLDQYRPAQNEIQFDVRGQNMGMTISMPPKNTLRTFVSSPKVATLDGLTLKGSHTYMTATSASNTDRLFMDLRGHRLAIELYGWLVHHFLKIKDNYFGDDMHFKTLEEFQGLPSTTLAADGTEPNGQPVKPSNDLDVILSISADESTVLLPSNLYSAERSIRADVPFVSADLRFTNYYMDLMVDFSPISASLGSSFSIPESSKDFTNGQTELFIESVSMFGHRLFGLPPTEPTYVCNWDFDIGNVSGECTPEFVSAAVGGARSFAFTLDDDENSLPVTDPIVIHDATFLRLRTADINVWLHVAQEALLLRTGPIKLDFNDLAGDTFSDRLSVSIPNLVVGAVDAHSASRQKPQSDGKQVVATHAYLQTTLDLNMFQRKVHFSANRKKQQAHIQVHDQRTHRAQFMLADDQESSIFADPSYQANSRPPAMQYPDIAQPLFLLQPDRQRGSSTAFSFTSSSYSLTGTQDSRSSHESSSGASFAGSIRKTMKPQQRNDGNDTLSDGSQTLFGGSPRRTGSERQGRGHFGLCSSSERKMPAFSVALSSSLATPHFPLNYVDFALTEVPQLPATSIVMERRGSDGIVFDNISTNELDENYAHTSLLIDARPGIVMYCTPTFIRRVSDLLGRIQPQRPDDLLDDFQLRVMAKLLDLKKRRQGKGTSLEFNIKIPFLHARMQHSFTPDVPGWIATDQYDVILRQLKFTMRIKKQAGELMGQNSLALHTTLESLGVSVTENSNSTRNQTLAMEAELKDLLVWAMQSTATSINVSFRSFETATASRKIEYLASLVHRTSSLVEELIAPFEEIEKKAQHRMRYLAWFLTGIQAQYSDPTFLIKASNTLRAAKDHLRTHDSWKIISRFRHTWHCVPSEDKSKLLDECFDEPRSCPADVEDKMVIMWDQWRAWDLSHVKDSFAMQMLFGRFADTLPSPQSAPTYLDIKSAVIKAIIDPGPRQSEVSLRMLSVNIAIMPPAAPSGLMLVGAEIPKRSITAQISARDSLIHIQWEICELVEALHELFQKDDLWAKDVAAQPLTTKESTSPAMNQDVHVVFVSDRLRIVLNTINLRSTSTGHRLRFSLVDEDRKGSGAGEILSAHLHLETALNEMFVRSKLLSRVQFEQPTLYFASMERAASTMTPKEMKAAASSRLITLKLEEDILGLIEAADLVLKEEVAYLHRQISLLQEAGKQQPTEEAEEKISSLPNISLALFMDAYQVELALLQPLRWSISGSSGRIAVVPALGSHMALRVDYDLQKSFHRLYGAAENNCDIISSLELPPLDGRITVTQSERETRILASGIVEYIQLQGSEIQALIATVNKPEMAHMIKLVQEDIEILQGHIKEVFPPIPSDPVVKEVIASPDILFDIHLTLTGMRVAASAPGKDPNSPAANLALGFSSVQIKATNIDSDQKMMLYPEAVIVVHEVHADMTLADTEIIRRCGNLTLGAVLQAATDYTVEPARRVYRIHCPGLDVNIFADTASAVVDVVNHLQDKIKDLDLSKERRYLRRLRETTNKISQKREEIKKRPNSDTTSVKSGALFSSTYAVDILDVQISWIVGTSIAPFSDRENEDLVLSFKKIDLSTHRDDAARLMIEDMQLQMVPISSDKRVRSRNSALLPKMVYNVAYASTSDTRQVSFHAAGRSLDLQLDSHFILPANIIERSIALAARKFRKASANWSMTPTTSGAQRKNPFGNKRLSSLTVDASFAGAVVHVNGSNTNAAPRSSDRAQQKGRYSQFVSDGARSSMALRAPGVALRVEYQDNGQDPSLNAELRVDGSSNTLLPTVVPIIIDISESIKAVVRDKDETDSPSSPEQTMQPSSESAKIHEDDNIMAVDPSTILGRTKLNVGLRICRQEFCLSCQPLGRVQALARLDDIYVTVNSVKSQDQGHFLAGSATFNKLQIELQHVYSRELAFHINFESIVLSLMNSRHLSGTSGISAILKINPTDVRIKAKELEHLMVFREIWYPPEIRQSSKPPTATPATEPQEHLMRRYQQVTAAAAFPWNASVAIAQIKVDLDLGPSIGRSSLHINNIWASSTKAMNWEQNLCVGVEKIGIESTGRTKGFIELHGTRVRTSISWPEQAPGIRLAPLIQISVSFRQLRVNTGFDYQAFVVADIANFTFLMYNVREEGTSAQDRLVALLDGDKVHVFCHATSAAQGLALWQAIERLIEEIERDYKQALKDFERYVRRTSSTATPFGRSLSQSTLLSKATDDSTKAPISLHTDVVVKLRSARFGVFPASFLDTNVLVVEAGDVQARFAAAPQEAKTHSTLGMTLGQLSVALSSTAAPKTTTSIAEITIEDVLERAHAARGGTILRVPKVIAIMHTWQKPQSNRISYIFKSSFEGKVDVGWNYSRIGYIRSMWGNHSRTLAQRLGKPLPESNIKISTSQTLPSPTDSESPLSLTTRPRAPSSPTSTSQEKITARVDIPQSRYEYTPIEPPIIETPQLRDMGEATPPLEWIGLHRDRLPNVTHQIVIVGLLEVSRKVENAYARILGSS